MKNINNNKAWDAIKDAKVTGTLFNFNTKDWETESYPSLKAYWESSMDSQTTQELLEETTKDILNTDLHLDLLQVTAYDDLVTYVFQFTMPTKTEPISIKDAKEFNEHYFRFGSLMDFIDHCEWHSALVQSNHPNRYILTIAADGYCS